MICDLCKKRPATLVDRTLINNGLTEYHFCDECYRSIAASGASAFEVMQRINARKGRECPVCGTDSDYFASTFTFGCPECYRYMRDIAISAATGCQRSERHVGKRFGGK